MDDEGNDFEDAPRIVQVLCWCGVWFTILLLVLLSGLIAKFCTWAFF